MLRGPRVRSAPPTSSATLSKSCALRRVRKPTICRATVKTRLLRALGARGGASQEHDAGAACRDRADICGAELPAKGAIKAGHDAVELAAALTGADVEDGLARYDAVRRPASALVVAESRRLGAYIEGKGKRAADPTTFMRENGGVEASNRADGGLFFGLLVLNGDGPRH